MKFTEAKLEAAFVELMERQGYPHSLGATLARRPEEVLIEADLEAYLMRRYQGEGITKAEVHSIIRSLKALPASDLYESNKTIMQQLRDGFTLKREDRNEKDFHVQLIDYKGWEEQNKPKPEHMLHIAADEGSAYAQDGNIYRFVTQMEVLGDSLRIPDGILYINGLPLVLLEFKSAIREEATIHDAYLQLNNRYRREIPELLKYNAFCIISDGVNNKAGTLGSKYEFYYAWRRVEMHGNEQEGINSLYSMVEGMLQKDRLRDIIRNFIYLPESSKKEEKIICRYPQYYAARALFANIQSARKPMGDGKGGTYFGATGCGKSYTMLFLSRLLMKSRWFGSPTIVLITDRTDLDKQLSELFGRAKTYLGDNNIISVGSREELRERLQGAASGGVFLTTIQKFTEDTQLLSERSNVICISDEAHRSQINLDQKIKITEEGVTKSYGFAKYLHDSLPNATFVGFTGTPIDATLDVFGPVVDAYTMTESVEDEITVPIVYEGRAAKVALRNGELEKIEQYYKEAAEAGANAHQIDASKTQMASMSAILGDPQRLRVVAEDFVAHYEARYSEGASVRGKAMFVCSTRQIAYALFQEIIALRPDWNIPQKAAENPNHTDKKDALPIEYIKMVMTRGKDDPKELWDMLGSKEYREQLDKEFKEEFSNFKIAIVVDMWLTGFDVPFLDTIYIDKPIQLHSLIQTISRVNRTFEGKTKGLVVDYIGIKKEMNIALAKYNTGDATNFEDIANSLVVLRNYLDLLGKLMHKFDNRQYFEGSPLEQLHTLNLGAEFIQQSKDMETRFMGMVKRLKAAYDICAGSEKLKQVERDRTHFYIALRSIIFKLTKGEAPDTAQMNARVRQMIQDALESEGVEEILRFGDEGGEQNLFTEEYLEKLSRIKLPNTKIKLLQKLLAKVIEEIKKVNRLKGIDFSKRMQVIVDRYNQRDESNTLITVVYEEIADSLTGMIWEVYMEFSAGERLGIDFEEKAFYDILLSLCKKYDFTYPDDKLVALARAVKDLVANQAKFPDWSNREDIKSSLKVGLILLLDEHGYPPVERDEVYVEIFEQAQNYKKYKG